MIKSFCNLKFSKKTNLLIIGEGDQYKNLNNFIKKNNLSNTVKIINFKKNPLNYINYCKCFILSSLWEGQSNALLQAALLKKNILCADTAGDAKLLSKKFENINIYKSNNFKDFEKKLKIILKIKTIFSKNKFHKLSENFASEEVAKKYIRIINEKI